MYFPKPALDNVTKLSRDKRQVATDFSTQHPEAGHCGRAELGSDEPSDDRGIGGRVFCAVVCLSVEACCFVLRCALSTEAFSRTLMPPLTLSCRGWFPTGQGLLRAEHARS